MPIAFKQRQSQYYIKNSTTLKNDYAHLADTFLPIIQTSQHLIQNTQFPHLTRHIQLLKTYLTPHLLYTLIVSLGPIPSHCNQALQNGFPPRSLTILRRLKMLPLPIDPIITLCPIQQIISYAEITGPLNQKIYKYISNTISNNTQPSPTTIQQQFP